MAKRTIYVKDQDEALFDRLAAEGNLSAVIARAVRGNSGEPETHHIELSVVTEESRPTKTLEAMMQIDPIAVQVGMGLTPMVDPARGALVLEPIRKLRQHVALELGIVTSGVRLSDSAALRANEYVIRIRDVERGRGVLEENSVLAVGERGALERFDGKPCPDFGWGWPARWISTSQRSEAQARALQILEPGAAMVAHLGRLVRLHAADLLGLQETDALLAPLRKTHPLVYDTAIPGRLSLIELWQLLRALLRSGVPIRDLPLILETLLLMRGPYEHARALEACRAALRLPLCARLSASHGELEHFTLDPELESWLRQPLSPETEELVAYVTDELLRLSDGAANVVLVTAPDLRAPLEGVLASVPGLVVLSLDDLRGVSARDLGCIAPPS